MKYSYGVAIPLYNPTSQQVNNIKKYKKSFDKVFIFDNSDVMLKKIYTFDDGFIYITEDTNKGLPYAFNYILNLEECKELDFLCTIDQDSKFEINEIRLMQDKIEKDSNLDLYGIIAPYIDYGSNNVKKEDKVVEKKWVISSGSFLNLKYLYRENIKYDEKYFIDRFEVDLCKQLECKGYKILMYCGAILEQELGYSNGGNKKKYANHSVNRHYYIFRNRFYFNNKWYKGIKKFYLNFLQTLKHILDISIYEDNKIEKIKQIKKAILDYNKMRKD